jgi:hypothetical protein
VFREIQTPIDRQAAGVRQKGILDLRASLQANSVPAIGRKSSYEVKLSTKPAKHSRNYFAAKSKMFWKERLKQRFRRAAKLTTT